MFRQSDLIFPAYPLAALMIYKEKGKVSQLVKEVKSRGEKKGKRTIGRPISKVRRKLKYTE